MPKFQLIVVIVFLYIKDLQNVEIYIVIQLLCYVRSSLFSGSSIPNSNPDK